MGYADTMTIADLLALRKEEKGQKVLSPKLERSVKEAQAISAHEKDTAKRQAINEGIRATLSATDAQAPLGITDPQLLADLERGPALGKGLPGNAGAFSEAAKERPEEARALIDASKRALGLDQPAGPAQEFRRTGPNDTSAADEEKMAYPSGIDKLLGIEVPRRAIRQEFGGTAPNTGSSLAFTNMPGAPGTPVDVGGTTNRGKLEDWATSGNPQQRAVARSFAEAENELKYGEKSGGVIGKQIAKLAPEYEQDVLSMGKDAADALWLKKVETGLPLPVVSGVVKLGEDKAADVAYQDYSKARGDIKAFARWNGVDEARSRLADMMKTGSNLKPHHAAAIDKELEQMAGSMSGKEGGEIVLKPFAYLPATKDDVAKWPVPAPDSVASGYVVDPFKPRTIVNPKGTEGPVEVTQAQHDETEKGLLDTVTGSPTIGAPAKPAYRYTTEGATAPVTTKGPGYTMETGGSFFDMGPSAAEEAGRTGDEGWGFLAGAGGAIEEALTGVAGPEGPLTRQARLRREAVRRARLGG